MNTKNRYRIRVFTEKVFAPLKALKVKKNRVICISHRGGRQYSDSPMYITEELLRRKGYEIIWIVNDRNAFRFLEEKGIRTVKHRSLQEIYYLNTSKVCITNLFRFPPYLAMDPEQLRINTMHGGGAYKSLLSINVDSGTVSKYDALLARHNINRCNLCLSGSRATSKSVYRKELRYRGEILEKGLPRNDSLLHPDPEIVRSVKEHYGVEDRMILVMPTWRRDNSRASIEIDYRKLVQAFERNYGGRWKVMLRLHHLAQIDISDLKSLYSDILVDATDYDNPQDLLAAADFLITDYSSVIWDFALKKGPMILYAPDLDAYGEERGFVIPPEKWKLNMARSGEELFALIDGKSLEELAEASEDHLKVYGSFESGEATKAVCDYIEEVCKGTRS